MSMETFRKAIAWAPPEFHIYFSGFSEPFMNPFCTEMILYAHKHKRHVGLFTTLMGASMKNMKAILSTLSFRQGEDWLVMHLPSDDKTERITVTDSYLKILQYVLAASGDNIDLHYHGNDLRKEVKWVVLSSHQEAYVSKLVSRSGNVTLPDESPPKRLRGSISCDRLLGMYGHTILPDGSVVLCCNDFGMKHVLGNIYTDNYMSIQSSKEMKKVLLGLDDKNIDILCRKCHFAENKDGENKYIKLLRLFHLLDH
jgi:radical SAM protein with 4Fe4S-binding SPASM domain